MYEIFLSSEFKKDAKKLSKNDLNLVGEILDRLASGECHIKPDLLSVYK